MVLFEVIINPGIIPNSQLQVVNSFWQQKFTLDCSAQESRLLGFLSPQWYKIHPSNGSLNLYNHLSLSQLYRMQQWNLTENNYHNGSTFKLTFFLHSMFGTSCWKRSLNPFSYFSSLSDFGVQVEFMLLELKRGYVVVGEVSRGEGFECTWAQVSSRSLTCMWPMHTNAPCACLTRKLLQKSWMTWQQSWWYVPWQCLEPCYLSCAG